MIAIDRGLINEIYRPLSSDTTKWKRGHALLIAGSRGKIGASVLAASACMRTGVGLLTIHVPGCGETTLHVSLPEAMLSLDSNMDEFTELPSLENFQAIGVGPGIGRAMETQKTLLQLIEGCHTPMVLDADALNILSMFPVSWKNVPTGSIITPHEREFQRIIGVTWDSIDERDRLALEFARSKKLTVVLKEVSTRVFCPDGMVYVNTLGNAGLAKAGNGDVLTGIITSLLAQGYSSKESCLLGLYLQGYSADLAVNETGEESLLASDVVRMIGRSIKALRN